jgi:hypothetical protein
MTVTQQEVEALTKGLHVDESAAIPAPAKKRGRPKGVKAKDKAEEAAQAEQTPAPAPESELLRFPVHVVSSGPDDEVTALISGTTYTVPGDEVKEYANNSFHEGAGLDILTVTRAYAEAHGFPMDAAIVASPKETELDLEKAGEAVAAEVAAKDAPTPRPAQCHAHYVGTDTVTVTVPLSLDLRAEYGDRIAALDEELEGLKMRLAAINSQYKAEIKVNEESRLSLSRLIRAGSKEETTLCDQTADYDTAHMVFTDIEPPYREVFRRKMTHEELQFPLPLTRPQNTDAAPPAPTEASPAESDDVPAPADTEPTPAPESAAEGATEAQAADPTPESVGEVAGQVEP